jgi:L-lactate dehydrogenase complex protein LldG
VTAREDVLQRVRAALGPDPSPVQVPRAYRRTTELERADLLDLLVERLRDYRAVVLRTSDVAAELAGLGRLVVPDGFPEQWLGAADVVCDTGLTARALDALDGVVTTCAVAVAETGTIVLDAGPGQGRRALTLVPDHHVVVVRADHVVGSVPEALRLLDPTRPQTWISGPSATSDIELQRVEGVHGPRRLTVLILEALG